MTNEATRLMAEALERVTVTGSFSPAEVGAGVGLDRSQAESAARALSDAGVLVLGFDCAAEFTPGFRKAHAATTRKGGRSKQPAAVTPAASARVPCGNSPVLVEPRAVE